MRMAVDENNYQMYVESRHFLLLCSENVLIYFFSPRYIVVIVGCRTGKQMGASFCIISNCEMALHPCRHVLVKVRPFGISKIL